jgi:hypothetical protein
MSWKGLTHKGTEILTPEEWNKVVDALDELKAMIKGGLGEFTGDGTTTTFNIAHGLGAVPTSAIVGKGASDLPDIDYWVTDETNITVYFKTPPASGATVKIWWIALKS